MANHVGTQLSRLLKERVYLGGEIECLETEVEEMLAQAEQKQRLLSEKIDRRTVLDEKIVELSSIDPDELKKVRAKPRDIKVRHGAIRSELINLLRDSPGSWRAGELVTLLAQHFGYPMETIDDRRKMRERIRRPLNLWRKEGLVKRLPDCPETGQGVWQWIGPRLGQPE